MMPRRRLKNVAFMIGFATGATATLSQAASYLTSSDVGGVISRVVQEANARHTLATVAVVDRMGAVLAVYSMANAPAMAKVINNPNGPNAPMGDGLNGGALPTAAEAIAKAITGAYLSSAHGNAFSTRTASQIIQDHFDPGTANTPSGPLYGVQFSQLPCSDLVVRLNPFDASSLTRGPHRSPVGLAGDPGGFPLYKNGELVGGVGVKTGAPYGLDLDIHVNDHNVDEILALAGTIGLDAPTEIRADQISVGGLLLRYSDATRSELLANPASASPFSALPSGLASVHGYYNPSVGLLSGSGYGSLASGLVQDTTSSISGNEQAYLLVDGIGHVRYPAIAGAGSGALTQAETAAILRNAYAIAIQTRAQIRNPPGSQAAVTISVVDAYGRILGIATVPDAPLFGIDVSLQKARSAAFLSSRSALGALGADISVDVPRFGTGTTSFFGAPVFSEGYAWSARAIGNIARDTFPDGIAGTPHGPLALSASISTPFADGLQLNLVIMNLLQHVEFMIPPYKSDTGPFCTQLNAPVGAPNPAQPVLGNGLQIFPGGFPIYRGNQLIGGIGVSGDGVDQDDLISFLGLYNAGQQLKTGVGNAPQGMRASVLTANGAAPHYVNCPFAPFLNSSAQNVCSGK